MKGNFELLMVIAAVCLPGKVSGEADANFISGSTPAQTATAIAARLDNMEPWSAEIKYAVALPMADDDVVYTLQAATSANPADRLLGHNYIIDWELPAESGTSEGFTAYFDGHCYRYRDHRLLEYHHQWDSIPFHTAAGGVQRNGQFVNLLPFSIAGQLRSFTTDSTYTIACSQSIVESRKATLLKISRHINGVESQQIEMAFDNDNGRPLKCSFLFNPGMLGEQEVTASYIYPDRKQSAGGASLEAVSSEEELLARYPDVFSKYRVSNFSLENLRGLPLPGFALPTPTRERYLYQKGARFTDPTIIAVLDPQVASTRQTIDILRQTVANLPRQTSLIMMFTTNDTDLIEPLTGEAHPGETVLTSATPFIRDCGINAYPTIILCNSAGTVSDVMLGYRNSLAEDLLQAAMMLK